MTIHIKRRHGGVGQAIRKMIHHPLELRGRSLSKNSVGGKYKMSKSTNDNLSTSDPSLETQRFILESLRNTKEISDLCYQLSGRQYPSLLNPPEIIGFSNFGTTLGFKGTVCEKCLSFEIAHVFDDVRMRSLRSNHICKPQRLHEARSTVDIQGMITKRRQELVWYLIIIVTGMMQEQEFIDLAAVEIPNSAIDKPLYQEFVDLEPLPDSAPVGLVYAAAKDGKTTINKIELAEFLATFQATLGFFRLKIEGVKRNFFIYISKGLDPREIKFLKKFYELHSNVIADIFGYIIPRANYDRVQDMIQFIASPVSNEPIPMLKLDIFQRCCEVPINLKPTADNAVESEKLGQDV